MCTPDYTSVMALSGPLWEIVHSFTAEAFRMRFSHWRWLCKPSNAHRLCLCLCQRSLAYIRTSKLKICLSFASLIFVEHSNPSSSTSSTTRSQDCYVFYNDNRVGASSDCVYCFIRGRKQNYELKNVPNDMPDSKTDVRLCVTYCFILFSWQSPSVSHIFL